MSDSILKPDECHELLSVSDEALIQWLLRVPDEELDTVWIELIEYNTPRSRAEDSLYEFVKQAWHIVEPDSQFIPGWHIRAICKHLMAVVDGKIRNLLINLPPGHCKSRICNVFLPAWVFIRNPSARFFHASYAQELATRDSIDCRYIIESDWYRRWWGDRVQLTRDQNQKTKFTTKARGWRMATSVGGRGTGEHPDFIIVDDPHNVRNAHSKKQREDCLTWWDSTIASRGLIRGVRKVVIMQRLHTSDLSGHILSRGGFEQICLPYRYEPGRMSPTSIGWTDPRTIPGELLWPKVNDNLKLGFDTFSPRLVASQLQQRPIPEGGAIFKRDWFQVVENFPTDAQIAVRYWDKAATADGGDYSAGVLMVQHARQWYIADVIRGRWSAWERNQIIAQTAQLDAQHFSQLTIVVEQEGGSGGKESADYTIQQLAGYHVRSDRPTGSKVVRCQPLASQCEAGNVFLVHAHWNYEFLEELCVFPSGDHDDMVDAAAGAFAWLTKTPEWEAPTTMRHEVDPKRHHVQVELPEGRKWERGERR